MNGIRLHVGSGCIYLTDGYTNVDVWNSGSALASQCPAGVKKWGTTSDRYYANVAQIDAAFLGEETPDHEAIVCDAYGTWTNLPFEDDSAAEVLSRQCWEHLSKTESRYALAEARRVLKVGGILRLDVPDHEATLAEYAHLIAEAATKLDVPEKIEIKRKAAFMLRHLLGSRKNDWAWHMGSWTREKLIEFCRSYGFKFVQEEPNIHFYPAFCLRFEKQPKCDFPELDEPLKPFKAAYEYAGEGRTPLTVPDDWKVLEIGPGLSPWPRANAYCDIVPRDLPNFTIGDVQDLPYPDRSVDYALASHVLEHVADPVKAASELSRVAKAGCVVSPTPLKEGLFLAHEHDHKWWVIAGKDRLFFHRIPEGVYPQIYDAELSGEAHRIWRYGERRLEGLCNKYKRHFLKIEPLIDAVFRWSPDRPLKVEVLE